MDEQLMTPAQVQAPGGTEDVYALIAGPNNAQAQNLGPLFYVPVWQAEPAGLGPPNQQQFQSGHTQNVKQNPSAEQGIGRSPGQRWPHYPHVQQFNPFRRTQVLQRDGQDGYSSQVYRPEISLIHLQALYQNQASIKFQSPMAVINPAPSIPYTFAVPQG
jgi:hypothetical protein